MGYFPNSISGRNKGDAASWRNAGRCLQPTRSYKHQYNWPQLVVLALGIHCRFGLFGRAGRLRRICQACLTRRTMLRSGQGGANTTTSSSSPLASDNAQISPFADCRGAAIIHTLSSPSTHYYFLLPSLATSFLRTSVTPAVLFLCFVLLTQTHMHTDTVCCAWPCNELIRADECLNNATRQPLV